jgi:thioredoxin-like negative regulator of GroEL
MTPIVNGLEQQYSEEIVFKRVNAEVGDGPEIMQAYRIPGHPTIMLFDGEGQEIQRILGSQSTETIEEALQRLLNNS